MADREVEVEASKLTSSIGCSERVLGIQLYLFDSLKSSFCSNLLLVQLVAATLSVPKPKIPTTNKYCKTTN